MPWPWFTIPLIVIAALAALAVIVSVAPVMVYRHLRQGELQTMCRGRLALTYDDGPGKHFTPKLLELLARHNAKATFYIVGFRADDAPALVEQMVRDGHELGNHGYWHRNAWRISPWQSVRDVRDGFAAVGKWWSGLMSYRPPFGNMTTWSWLAAQRHGASVHWWTCDAGDQNRSLPKPDDVAAEVERAGGAVVLMHNHDSGEAREQYVLDVTERLLAAATEHGWSVCTMSQLTRENVETRGAAAA